MRTLALILSMALAVALVACGLFNDDDETPVSHADISTVAPDTSAGTGPAPVAPDMAAPAPVGSGTSLGVAPSAPIGYLGPTSLEERIFASHVIAQVRLDSSTSTVESATAFDGSTKYIAMLEFSFSVEEYLKGAPPTGSGGSGGDDIVAVWESRPVYDTRQEAEDALPAIAGARDAQWDDREAIVFLQNSQTYLTSTQQADRYYLTWQHEIDFDDKYSIASRHHKLWLPAEAEVGAASQPTGNQQRFLTDVPPAAGTPPTITLGELKTRIAAVVTKLDAGDGSEEYTECVRETYYLERKNRYLEETYPDRVNTGSNISPPHTHQFNSGLAGGAVVYELPEGSDITPGIPFEAWLDGGDSDLFSVASPSQDYRVTSMRPLYEGTYKFHFNHRGPYYSRCDGYTTRYEWTITAIAPDGTLHEAFFDPITDGNAVAADSTSGVLKPAAFTGSNGATTTIQRIAWEPGSGATGTVKMRLSPHTGITGQVADFIALDGSVTLSLNVADATVDAATNTLRWPAPSQPWHTGDKLMLRIRDAPTPTATPDPPEGVASPVPTVSDTAQSTIMPSKSLYLGQSSLEERILASPVIVRARLGSATSTVEFGPTVRGTEPIAILEFHFRVQEYLKGSGGSDIVAVWNSGLLFDTREEAEAALPAIAAARDAQWDDREAIIFLQHSQTYLPSTQEPERYYLSGDLYFNNTLDDYYSIGSPYNKLWLPADTAVGRPSQPGGDQQRFLLDVPPATGSAPTITLGEVKARIAAVTAKVAAGDGSEEYMQCVTESYFLERLDRHLRETRPERLYTGTNISPPHVHQIGSGLAAGSVVYRLPEGSDIAPYVSVQVWLDSGDEGLFDAATPSQDYRVLTSRPLIDRIYNFYFNHRIPGPCEGWAVRYEWTVTAIAPEGVLHEAFFDPVTDGNAVAADTTNGVLKPAVFTAANGATSTIQRIAWEPRTVKMRLSPHTGITGHALDFIALDGSVSLSLNVADATVDAANNTLTWPVPSQPWHSGDKLMFRIRDER